MSCTSPVRILNPATRHLIPLYKGRLVVEHDDTWLYMSVSCGRCTHCRYQLVKDWAIRSEHEMRQHKVGSFITLTYNEENNPITLKRKHVQYFIKRLRYHLSLSKVLIKVMYCGEYGTKKLRPHYHLCIFGWSPEDKKLHSYNDKHQPIYNSDILSKLWSYGYNTVGDLNASTAAYVAGYSAKYVGLKKTKYDEGYCEKTGVQRCLTFFQVSRGLGLEQAKAMATQMLTIGYIVSRNGYKHRIPRYYIKKIEEALTHCELLVIYKEAKLEYALSRTEEPPERLADIEHVRRSKLPERSLEAA